MASDWMLAKTVEMQATMKKTVRLFAVSVM